MGAQWWEPYSVSPLLHLCYRLRSLLAVAKPQGLPHITSVSAFTSGADLPTAILIDDEPLFKISVVSPANQRSVAAPTGAECQHSSQMNDGAESFRWKPCFTLRP